MTVTENISDNYFQSQIIYVKALKDNFILERFLKP